MKNRKEGGEERKVPVYSIENSKLSLAARVTKNKMVVVNHNHMVCV